MSTDGIPNFTHSTKTSNIETEVFPVSTFRQKRRSVTRPKRSSRKGEKDFKLISG